LTVKDTRRDEALAYLRTMLEETARAQHLVSAGSAIPTLQELLRVRHLGKQSIAALLGDCLSATILQAAQADQVTLSRLAELIGFAQQALCQACRSEVGKRWKEAEDV
jgi:hypothetical protein